MPNRNPNGGQLRQQIASEAARIMATEARHNYLNAKQKAAERLGHNGRKGLPSNTEVAAALKDYLELFGGPERKQAVQKLLTTALSAMEWLAEFEPRLSGALADGLANQFSPVHLHLFSDDPDAPIHFLMAQQRPYHQDQKRIRWYRDEWRSIEIIRFQAGEHTVELWLFGGDELRQAPPSPIDGRPRSRMDIETVRRLLDAA